MKLGHCFHGISCGEWLTAYETEVIRVNEVSYTQFKKAGKDQRNSGRVKVLA